MWFQKMMERCSEEGAEVDEDGWYEKACSSRLGWRAACRLGLESSAEVQATAQASGQAAREVVCEMCSRSFRRESDKMIHKCSGERQKPVWEQQGAAQCAVGGLAVHTRIMPYWRPSFPLRGSVTV